jgi:hypothetical protein
MRQHADSTAFSYLFDASMEMAEHIAESVQPPTALTAPMPSLVTHYGESFNGSILGCGTGYYSSDNPTIVAVSPAREGEMPCGTLLQICGYGGCITAQRQDACPGCSAILFDLSESAFLAVCGQPTGVCEATVSIVETCTSLSLAWEDRPVQPPPVWERERTALDDLSETALLSLPPDLRVAPPEPEDATASGDDLEVSAEAFAPPAADSGCGG